MAGPAFDRNVISWREVSFSAWVDPRFQAEQKSLNLTLATFYWSELGTDQPRFNADRDYLRA